MRFEAKKEPRMTPKFWSCTRRMEIEKKKKKKDGDVNEMGKTLQ